MLAQQSRIKAVPVQVRHVQEVDLAVAAQSRPLLSGKTNHEPKYAGFFHGSDKIVPPDV